MSWKSSLDMYEEAYTLHYQERKLAEARDLYDKIIEHFPDSDEAGYAVVQIGKIDAQSITRTTPSSRSRPTRKAVTTAVILSCVACIGVLAGGGALFFFVRQNQRTVQQLKTERESTRRQIVAVKLLLTAVGKAGTGHPESAIQIVREVKTLTPGDKTPYIIAADIYQHAGKYDRAIQEYQDLGAAFPLAEFVGDKIAMLKKEQARHRDSLTKAQTPPRLRKPNIPAPVQHQRMRSPRNGQSSGEVDSSLLIVDSVDFF